MADAGRIQHHIKNNIWRSNATILFVGYQAPGTLGHYISSGEPVVRIHGKEFLVKAEIRQLGNYSAHADQGELLEWVEERGPVAGRLFLNHGDDDAREEMARLLAERGFDPEKIVLPQMDEVFELVAGDAKSKGRLPERIPRAELLTDWNNDYAAFIVTLTQRLAEAEDDEERRRIIAALRRAL
jgi:metallo-beta-lactamase family protein